jgi:integrase
MTTATAEPTAPTDATARRRDAAFTMNRLERIAPPESGRLWVRDPKTPGLALVVTFTGSRSWYLYKKVNGRPRKIKLGDFPTLSVEDARRAAAEDLGKIARRIDPSIERKRIRQETTLGEFWLVVEQHAKARGKRTWEQDVRRYEKRLKPWANRRLSDISRDEVQNLHERIGKDAPYEANRVIALISKVFSLAIKRGWDGLPPTRGIEKFHEEKRSRRLSPDELRRLWTAVHAHDDRNARDFVLLAILTGLRSGNVLEMRWDWIDFEHGVLTIPGADYKNKEEQRPPLHPAALAILRNRRRDAAPDAVYVFPGRPKDVDGQSVPQPRKGFRRHWYAMLKAAGIPQRSDDWQGGLVCHDLRRTFGSFAADEGVPILAIGKMLGHRNAKTTEVYARLRLDPVREAVNRTVAGLLTAAGVKDTEPDIIDAEPVKPAPTPKKAKPAKK